MISLPIIESLRVEDFELYPGTPGHPGLSATFEPGVTLVLGANGLGKSTLVQLMFRLLGGNAEIRNAGFDQLGGGRLGTRTLNQTEVRTFAARVADAASKASATINLTLGSTNFEITRDLASLTLTALALNGELVEPDENLFRESIVEAAGIEDYLDWLLILRYLVFYFDDRRSLVWDPSAQRRLLPLLFESSSYVGPIEELTNEVLSRDSYVRNLGSTLTRQERELQDLQRATAAQPVIAAKIEDLLADRDRSATALDELNASLPELEATRDRTRLEALRSAERTQSMGAELDRARIREVRLAFPSLSESSTYLLTQLARDGVCLACGTESPDAAAEFQLRLSESRCVLCNTELRSVDEDPAQGSEVEAARESLADARAAEAQARDDAELARRQFNDALAEVAQLTASVHLLSQSIVELGARLPESDLALARRRETIAALRADQTVARDAVVNLKLELERLVEDQNRRLTVYKDHVKRQFDEHARDFLVESCELVWARHAEQIGQIGRGIGFAVFQVDMGGGSIAGLSRRSGAEQVSESQREFIDLAFRMALIDVAAAGGVGSIVIDAPESSLDAVFAPRAADVLTSFGGEGSSSRMVITSNLVDGQLIPRIAERTGISSVDDPRVVNLFEVAAKTAALRELQTEYDEALSRVFTAPGAGS